MRPIGIVGCKFRTIARVITIDDQNRSAAAPTATAGHTRLFYLLLAYAALALGIAGVFLPLLPTTPFLLVAVWAASRGSQRVHDWIYDQPRFARLLNDWQQQGAVPLSAKWLATAMMIASWLTLWATAAEPLMLAGISLFFLVVGGFLWTRPRPKH